MLWARLCRTGGTALPICGKESRKIFIPSRWAIAGMGAWGEQSRATPEAHSGLLKEAGSPAGRLFHKSNRRMRGLRAELRNSCQAAGEEPSVLSQVRGAHMLSVSAQLRLYETCPKLCHLF